VLEDDVEFHPEAAEQWAATVQRMPGDWLMIHGAQDHEVEPLWLDDHWGRVRQSYGTHFMIMTSEAIRMLASDPARGDFPADWLLRTLFQTGRAYCPRLPIVRHLDSPGGMPA
jgi:hypothetical protein